MLKTSQVKGIGVLKPERIQSAMRAGREGGRTRPAQPDRMRPRRAQTMLKTSRPTLDWVSAAPTPTRTSSGGRCSRLRDAESRSKASDLTLWSTGRATLTERRRNALQGSRPRYSPQRGFTRPTWNGAMAA